MLWSSLLVLVTFSARAIGRLLLGGFEGCQSVVECAIILATICRHMHKYFTLSRNKGSVRSPFVTYRFPPYNWGVGMILSFLGVYSCLTCSTCMNNSGGLRLHHSAGDDRTLRGYPSSAPSLRSAWRCTKCLPMARHSNRAQGPMAGARRAQHSISLHLLLLRDTFSRQA